MKEFNTEQSVIMVESKEKYIPNIDNILINKYCINYKDRAWIEVNMDNLKYNIKTFQKILPEQCSIMAVVKANAYGHGSIQVSRMLNNVGVYDFAVATIDEGIKLRTAGIKGNILILGYTSPNRIGQLINFDLSQTVVDIEHALNLDDLGKTLKVHIKINTGMNRLGENYFNLSEIEKIFSCKNFKIQGIFTHLSVADSNEKKDVEYTKNQINKFYSLIEQLKYKNIKIPKIHIQSSYGVLNYPNIKCDYARLGIAIYGVLSHENCIVEPYLDLKPVLMLKSRIALIRTINYQESIGYGNQYISPRISKIAVVSIGYGDGYPRSLSGNSEVLLNGCRVPIIGRICMDQMMIDITDIRSVKRGDIVTLIGSQGNEIISAEELSLKAKTITNELLCRLSQRLERIYIY